MKQMRGFLSGLLALLLALGSFALLPAAALMPGDTVAYTLGENVSFQNAWDGVDPAGQDN